MMQQWFRDAKLGIFIHYGILCSRGCFRAWSFHNGAISYEDYMKQCEGFTASKLDMRSWAKLFKKAGAQYAVMTTKHHDGVALFDTKYSDLSVVKRHRRHGIWCGSTRRHCRRKGLRLVCIIP